MSTVDVYRITDQLDDPSLDAIVTRLEARGKHPRFVAMMQQYFDAMNIDSAESVLDLGCGTGVATRAIARRPGFRGRVTGIDLSPYFVAVAERLAAAENIARIDFRVGDSQSLSLPDEGFDAVVVHTLVSHVNDPLAVLREVRRILKPGGTVGIFDGDYASMTFAGDDPVKSKETDDAIIQAIVTQPRVMRQMPQLLREAGLAMTASFAHDVADIGKADFFAPALQSFLKLLPRSGAMTEPQAQLWVAAMLERSEQGIFFGASNFYSYVARRR
jgi:SAM-dependent methyltransferase